MPTLQRGGYGQRLAKWKRKYKQNITVKSDNNYHFTEFRFFDEEGEEIKL